MFESLHEVVGQIEHLWPDKRVLVVGDVMLDKYIWGEVGRISPEAPVPVVKVTHRTEQPGGAANVAMNLALLGAQTSIIGFAGDDEDQKLLVERLRPHHVTPELIVTDGFPTITKTRILGTRQQMLRLDQERLEERSQSDYDRLVERALARIPNCDALVLSDYAKGSLSPEVCQTLIQAGRKIAIPVLVDPKSPDFSRYRGATTICPNLAEISAAAQQSIKGFSAKSSHGLEALLAIAETMVQIHDFAFVTATLSEKGIALVRRDGHFVAPAAARQVFDVSGAGDTVIAVLALSLASGLSPELGAELANIAAGVVVGKVGTVPIEKHELLAALNPQMALNATEKVTTRPELLTRVATWRANGERVVFTNGCFDLLHVGHISLLEQARRFGDRLIVAINSDSSVRGLKGPNRPVVGENERARVLAALAVVDAVSIFEESTPLNLILAVKPDIIVKGGDYSTGTVVGAAEALSWGGQTKIVPLVEGFSTTSLIAKSTGAPAG